MTRPCLKRMVCAIGIVLLHCPQAGGAIQWHVHPVPPEGTNSAPWFRGVAFGSEKFVAVTDNGEVYSAVESDPESWTRIKKIPDALMENIFFADGRFIAVGFDTGTTNALLLTSSNAVHWERQRFNVPEPLTDVAYGDGTYIVMGQNFLARSTNLLDWVRDYSFVRGMIVVYSSVDYVRGEFMLVTAEQANTIVWPTTLAIANDGTDWQLHGHWLPGFQNIAYGRKLYVGLGDDDCVPCGSLFISSDGRSWDRRGIPGNANGMAITYANGVFAIAGWGRPSAMLTSTNGTEWDEFKLGDNDFLSSIIYGGGKFVAVGRGLIVVSDFIGFPPFIVSPQMSADVLEFQFNAEEKAEWLVEGSEDLFRWRTIQQIEGTPDRRQTITIPNVGQGARFLRMREVR